MPTPRAVRKALVEKDLEELLDTIGRELSTTWAVYADFQQHDMSWQVKRIVPWLDRDLEDPPMAAPFRVVDAVDELDAYKKFMEQTK